MTDVHIIKFTYDMKHIKILGIVLFSLFLILTFMDFYKGFLMAITVLPQVGEM